jgi:phage-related protein
MLDCSDRDTSADALGARRAAGFGRSSRRRARLEYESTVFGTPCCACVLLLVHWVRVDGCHSGLQVLQTPAGNEPVRVWLRAQAAEVKKAIGTDIKTVQFTWPIGKPLVDGFGDGLYEVRSRLDGNIYRMLFCLDGRTMVLLHAFQKKSQRTSKSDIELARKRMTGDETS